MRSWMICCVGEDDEFIKCEMDGSVTDMGVQRS
jgi:hypothetical protein